MTLSSPKAAVLGQSADPQALTIILRFGLWLPWL